MLEIKTKSICTLDKNKFNCISTCYSTYNIWHALEVTHIGTSKVNETKGILLFKDFEFFVMK